MREVLVFMSVYKGQIAFYKINFFSKISLLFDRLYRYTTMESNIDLLIFYT